MTRATYGYVYGGTVTYQGEILQLDGTAWSLEACDETKLRAAALRDLSANENVSLAEIEIVSFWYSGIVLDDGGAAVQHPCTDPFRLRDVPGERPHRDTVDPFRPAD